MNNAAEHLCRVAILNPLQESYLLWRANTVISFELREPKLIMIKNLHSTNLHILHVVFFADNFREGATLNAVYDEIFKLDIFIESG